MLTIALCDLYILTGYKKISYNSQDEKGLLYEIATSFDRFNF